jgi:hypothetical protein
MYPTNEERYEILLNQDGARIVTSRCYLFTATLCYLYFLWSLISQQDSPHASTALPNTAPTSKHRTNASKQDQSPIIRSQSPPSVSDNRTQLQKLNARQSSSNIPNASSAVHEPINHTRADRFVMLRSFFLEILDPSTPGRRIPTREETIAYCERDKQARQSIRLDGPQQENAQRRPER